MHFDFLLLAPWLLGAMMLIAAVAGTKYLYKARRLVSHGRRHALEDAFSAFAASTVLFVALLVYYPVFRLVVGITVIVLVMGSAILLNQLRLAGKLPRSRQAHEAWDDDR